MAHFKERAVLESARRPIYATVPGTGPLQCLVVCADQLRRRDLADRSGEAGWVTFESGDVAAAIDFQLRMRLHLAIIDFTGTSSSRRIPLRRLVTGLSRERDLLLMVCGGEGCVEEEVWARQLGVWIYLPGLMNVSELSPLLVEARDLAERLIAARASPLADSAAWTH